jgi:FkbM family methyltransferase
MNWLYNLIYGFSKLVLSDDKHRTELIVFWIKIKILQKFSRETESLKSLSFINQKLYFYSYSSLVYLFEEVFIQKVYKFSSNKKNPYVFDVGANIGLATLFFKLQHPEAKIVCFEADEQTAVLLRKNTIEQNHKDIEIHQVGLWSSEGEKHFYVNQSCIGALNQGFMATDRSKSIIIQTKLLSKYIDQPIQFFKMDVEGAENEIFIDLEKQSKFSLIESFAIEAHLLNLAENRLSYILDVLQKFGFIVKIGTHSLYNRDFNQAQDCMLYGQKTAKDNSNAF